MELPQPDTAMVDWLVAGAVELCAAAKLAIARTKAAEACIVNKI